METRKLNLGSRTPEGEKLRYEAKLQALRIAIDEGDVFTQVRKALQLPANPS
jgi:hypothetical protein